MKAIITPAPRIDHSRPPRFNVGVEHPDGRQITRYLIRGPWSRSTAYRKARELQLHLDAGTIKVGVLTGKLQ